MGNKSYALLPPAVQSTESLLPLYSKQSHPDGSLQLDKAASNLEACRAPGQGQTPSGRRYGIFTVCWTLFSEHRRTVMCELDLTKEQTANHLLQAIPTNLGFRSADNMVFQIPAGKNWARVMDSDWNDLMIGQTYEEIKVELVMRKKDLDILRLAVIWLVTFSVTMTFLSLR